MDPHRQLYEQWFRVADSNNDGRLLGNDAVPFFERSGLPKRTLAMVWSQADQRKWGYLTLDDFVRAMQMISLAQQGEEVSQQLYQSLESRQVPPPKMRGLEGSGGAANPFGDDADPSAPQSKGSQQSGEAHPAWMPSALPSKKSFGWNLNKHPEKRVPQAVCTSVIDGLKQIYFQKVKPLEEQFRFGAFFSPYLTEGDFHAMPSVLLLGQYSTGKTTFIKHMLGRDYPGCNIGPEPTTDRFVVVHWGPEERRIPGNTLAVQPDKPYQGLSVFGTGFLGRFEGATAPLELLEEISLVDTPGVLSGEKQRIERQYDFVHVCAWFAARADMILLLFDPNKLDISDEFKEVISSLRGHDDKVRVVLNKADQVSHQQLMRVYGALMWSLGKVFRSPEVCRVYIGSFNFGEEVRVDVNPHARELFAKEQQDLMTDLYDIPKRSADRKINEFVKRIRAFRIHMLIVAHMKRSMPSMFGKKAAQDKMLASLPEVFGAVQRANQLAPGDFPDPRRYRDTLAGFDLWDFPKIDRKMEKVVEDVLAIDIPSLVKYFDNPYQLATQQHM